ncbi:Protein of uncharacterised function (DUF2971) [Streptococcus cristatus]|uniref:DUF2971 domain-containing protein n=1 Tax=Streptococcus cristatus TaxID=45634 RepID=A0A512AAH7_STRCR|nr:DUF2971 domain-containing protein [Streptococcus cristatus]GEN96693.1 hypothetical protein SOL01_05670 [Streptococcus cristatus]SQI46509.1 Protein of uncharacterised function (DUF2971) [Streptococcus cristatus]
MFKIAWDNASYYKNFIKSEKAPNTFVFYTEGWDDYRYKITYIVCFYNQDLEETLLGYYRIYNPEVEEKSVPKRISILIDQDLDNDSFYSYDNDYNIVSIKDTYYSLAWSSNFYQELYKLGAEYYEKFLKIFRDLTVIDLPDDIKENVGVKKALLRNNDITNSEEIIELNQQLKKIDERLNIGNWVSVIVEELKDDQLDDEKIESFSKIIEVYDFDYDLYFDSLSELVRVCIEKYHMPNFDKIYKLIKLLLDKTDFEQLKSELEVSKNDDLRKIKTSVMKIKDTLKYPKTSNDDSSVHSPNDDSSVHSPNDDSFVHYTSLKTLKFLLYKSDENKSYPKLRLSNARQMNDPNEGYTLFNLIGIEKKDLPITDYDSSPFFFASMTKIGKDQKLDDSLPMWKQYGDDAKGINLTYHSDYIKSLIDEGIEIYEVCYKIEENSLEEEIKTIKSALDNIRTYEDSDRKKFFSMALKLIDVIRYLFKEADYSYEKEYRIIKSYEGKNKEIITSDSSNSVIPGLYVYIDKQLKYSKIKLGPKCDDIDFVAPYIKHIDGEIEVTRSEISYR